MLARAGERKAQLSNRSELVADCSISDRSFPAVSVLQQRDDEVRVPRYVSWPALHETAAVAREAVREGERHERTDRRERGDGRGWAGAAGSPRPAYAHTSFLSPSLCTLLFLPQDGAGIIMRTLVDRKING